MPFMWVSVINVKCLLFFGISWLCYNLCFRWSVFASSRAPPVFTFVIAEFDIDIVHSCKSLLIFIWKQEADPAKEEDEDREDTG